MWESIWWLWRNVRLKRKNPENITFLPKKICLNKINSEYSLVFIGDIMDLGHKFLEISSGLKNFVQASDFLIGNFEAIITDAKPRGVDQVHDEKVIEGLKKFYPPSRTYLSVANNHAGDFGRAIFERSVQILADAGFNVFGTVQNPVIELTSDVHVATGTMWSNRTCDFITYIKDIKRSHLKAKAMNIFYPHWGYDLELYPRLPLIKVAQKFLQHFDAIVGHHTHSPEPIISVSGFNGSLTKLCAYSLGDFCFGKQFGRLLSYLLYNYNYGVVLKMEIGTTNEGHWATGEIEWTFIESIKKNPETMLVVMRESNPYHPGVE